MTDVNSVSTNCSFMVDNAERRRQLFGTNIAVIVLNSIFALTTTFQNLPVIYSILKTPSLHNPPYVLLCSLATTDLFVGCFIQPLYIAHNAMLVDGQRFSCGLWYAKETLLLLFMFLSICTLVLISTERWLALHFHLRYREIVTMTRTLSLIGLTWFFCTASVIAWPLGLDMYIFTMVGIIVITIAALLLLFTYIKIFLILRHHRALIESQAKLQPQSVNLRKHRKSSATMLYVVVLFFIFYSPTFYAMIHYLESDSDFSSVDQTILWEVAKNSGVDKRLGKSGDVLLENAGTSTRHAKRIRVFVSNAGSRRRCPNARIRKHGQLLQKQERTTAPRFFLGETAGKQRGAFQV